MEAGSLRERILALAVLTLLASAALPSALAATSTTEHHAMFPSLASPYFSPTHQFSAELDLGETLNVSLEWEGPNQTDLDLEISGPGPVCSITDVQCLAGVLPSLALSAACQGDNSGEHVNLGTRTENRTITADQAGTWTIFVMASTAVPGEAVPYNLTVWTSDDGADSLLGPDGTNLIREDGHCRSLAPLP